MTLDRLVWDNLLQLEEGEREVVSMTIVLKDYNDGTISCYVVDQFGCFCKIGEEE